MSILQNGAFLGVLMCFYCSRVYTYIYKCVYMYVLLLQKSIKIVTFAIKNKNMLRVKEILEKRGTSVSQMARDLGLSRVTVSNQINSDDVRVSTLRRIASYLNVPIYALFSDFPGDITCPRCGRVISHEEFERT